MPVINFISHKHGKEACAFLFLAPAFQVHFVYSQESFLNKVSVGE